PLLHGLHARDAAALPRARGGERRGGRARAEPVLGRGRRRLRPRRRRAGDDPAAARRAHVAARHGAERTRASAFARAPRRDRRGRGAGARRRERLGAAAAPCAGCLGTANEAVLSVYRAKGTFGATELERFADCSSAWLHERVVAPRTIDAEVDAMLRGQVLHQTLFKFYAGLPKELGADDVTPGNVEQAVGFLRRCLDDALRGGVRLELTELQAAELEGT